MDKPRVVASHSAATCSKTNFIGFKLLGRASTAAWLESQRVSVPCCSFNCVSLSSACTWSWKNSKVVENIAYWALMSSLCFWWRCIFGWYTGENETQVHNHQQHQLELEITCVQHNECRQTEVLVNSNKPWLQSMGLLWLKLHHLLHLLAGLCLASLGRQQWGSAVMYLWWFQLIHQQPQAVWCFSHAP